MQRQESVIASNESSAAHYQKLVNLDKRIRKLSKSEAPARAFLVLNELFKRLDEDPLPVDQLEEAMLVCSVENHLKETFIEYGKGDYYNEAMKVLSKMNWSLKPPDEGYFCWQTFWHFNLIRDELISGNTWTIENLHKRLCQKYVHVFRSFVYWCKERDVIRTHNDNEYELGPSYEECERGPLIFSEHECLLYLSDPFYGKCSDEALPTSSDVLTWYMHGSVQCKTFKETLSEMAVLNLCVV